MAKIYVCTGSCKGTASEEQYQNGATNCAAETCEKHGQPLEPREQCEPCNAAGEGHWCPNC